MTAPLSPSLYGEDAGRQTAVEADHSDVSRGGTHIMSLGEAKARNGEVSVKVVMRKACPADPTQDARHFEKSQK